MSSHDVKSWSCEGVKGKREKPLSRLNELSGEPRVKLLLLLVVNEGEDVADGASMSSQGLTVSSASLAFLRRVSASSRRQYFRFLRSDLLMGLYL